MTEPTPSILDLAKSALRRPLAGDRANATGGDHRYVVGAALQSDIDLFMAEADDPDDDGKDEVIIGMLDDGSCWDEYDPDTILGAIQDRLSRLRRQESRLKRRIAEAERIMARARRSDPLAYSIAKSERDRMKRRLATVQAQIARYEREDDDGGRKGDRPSKPPRKRPKRPGRPKPRPKPRPRPPFSPKPRPRPRPPGVRPMPRPRPDVDIPMQQFLGYVAETVGSAGTLYPIPMEPLAIPAADWATISGAVTDSGLIATIPAGGRTAQINIGTPATSEQTFYPISMYLNYMPAAADPFFYCEGANLQVGSGSDFFAGRRTNLTAWSDRNDSDERPNFRLTRLCDKQVRTTMNLTAVGTAAQVDRVTVNMQVALASDIEPIEDVEYDRKMYDRPAFPFAPEG